MENIYINQQLLSYAYLASSFDSRTDVFKNYVSLIEHFLIEKKFCSNTISFEVLHSEINSMYQLSMPQATLRHLLKVMQKNEKVKINGSHLRFDYSKFTSSYINKKEELADNLKNLVNEIIKYFKTKKTDIDNIEAKSLVLTLVVNNSLEINKLFGLENNSQYFNDKRFLILIEYIKKAVEEKNTVINVLTQLTFGAIRASLLNLSPNKIKDISLDELLIEKVVLDTNYLLRLLNLQAELDCKIALETYEILKDLGSEVIVMEDTIHELIASVKNFLSKSSVNTTTLNLFANSNLSISGFLAAERRGFTRTNLLNYTNYEFIYSQLSKLNIKIVNENIVYDDKKIPDIIEKKNRESYNKDNAIHDLKLISYVKLLRKNKAKKFNQEKIWALTNDAKLFQWEKNNSNNFGFACITETQLASFIWLKKGNNQNIELTNTLIALSNYNTVGIDEISKFQKQLNDYYISNPSEEQINNLALIFSCGEVEKQDLLDINDNETMEIFITNKLERIKVEEQEKNLDIEKSKLEFSKVINKQYEDKNNKINDLNAELSLLNDKFTLLKDKKENIENELINYEKVKKRLATTFRFLLSILVAIGVGAYFISKNIFEIKLDIFLSIIISIVFPTIIILVISLASGSFCDIKEAFLKINYFINKKYIYSLIETKKRLNKEDIADYIVRKNEELCEIESNIKNIDIEKQKINFAIQNIEDLILANLKCTPSYGQFFQV